MTEPRISHAIPVSQQAVRMIQQEALEEIAQQIESEEDLSQYFELSLFNPMLQAQRFRNFKDLQSHLTHKKEETEKSEEIKVFSIENIDQTAARFQQNNNELSARSLRTLRSLITAEDTPDDVLKKVLSIYADPSLADEALDFLLETSDAQTRDAILAAKKQFTESHEREIKAGRNMGTIAREFSKEGLGTPTNLRDLYRDITGNPREPLNLFNELADKFRYPKLKSAITFLLHSLGQDLKSKGPSIQRGELKRLLDETRSLQGILGVFRFFQARMRLIQREFASYNLILPSRLDFEALSKVFIKILGERYMNPEKIIQTAKLFGISQEAAAQLIIYTQMRDALKQIAPRYFRNPQHRDELHKAFLDTLDKLEEELEEEEEEK